MNVPIGPVTRAPGVAYRLWHFNKWRKARRRVSEQLVTEAIQQALFPHSWESDEAQYAGRALWRVMQEISVPGEEGRQGFLGRGASRGEHALYGRMPRSDAPGVSYQRRLALWFEKALLSDDGQDVLREIDSPRVRELDAQELGALFGRIFGDRLGIQRYRDPEGNRARIWLSEGVRKYDTAVGLAGQRRAETGVTQAIELSTALLGGGTVTYILDDLGVHGLASAAAAYGTVLAVYFGSRILLRRRPLLPRQVGFRLYVLDVLSDFLVHAGNADVGVDRTVAGALDALRRLRSFAAAEVRGSSEPMTLDTAPIRGAPVGTGVGAHELWSFGQLAAAELDPSTRSRAMVALLRQRTQRLVELAGDVDDTLVQAELIRLEATITTAQSPLDILNAIGGVLEALSR